MPFSTCPYCGGRSYSAAVQKTWICPYCGIQVEEKTAAGKKRAAAVGNVYKLF
ncbi:MAG: hypothetical protein ACOX3A_06660 [bacterium]